MAVPNLGALSLRGLAREKIYDDYSNAGTPTVISLGNLATGTGYDATNTLSTSKPDTTAPHSMGEWYGYDHDAIAVSNTSFIASGTNLSSGDACTDLSIVNTFWHDGSSSLPVAGDGAWANEAHSLSVGTGWYNIGSGKAAYITGDAVDTISICL